MDGLGCFGHLLWCHGEGLVAWQEGHIDIGNVFHLVDILCISGNIYPETIDSKHEAVVASLRMELFFSLRCIVSRNSLYVPFADGCRVTVLHHLSLAAKHVAASAVGYQLCVLFGELADGFGIQMVGMLVCEQDEVCLWQCREIGDRRNLVCYGVYVYPLAANAHPQRTVLDAVNPDERTIVGGEHVYLLFAHLLACLRPSVVASAQFSHLVSVVGEDLCSLLAALSASAV